MEIRSTIPQYDQWYWETLEALRQLGDSGSIEEIDKRATELAGLTEAQLSVLHNNGPGSEASYRLAWARTYLRFVGLVDTNGRGVWTLTDKGRGITKEDVPRIRAEAQAIARSRRKARASEEVASDSAEIVEISEPTWQESLLDVLQSMDPSGFEKLSQRLLRESGFTQVEVMGRSGDGGIDGIGVLRIALLSFQVYSQCKRYKGTVGAGTVRDFRGAMVGRTDKGLIITTGTFTQDAKREATRDGAPPIELVDGEELCSLLKETKLGVETEMVEHVTVDRIWFDQF